VREALNGYQKGHCFYCFDRLSLVPPDAPDIDHFFPHVLTTVGPGWLIDGLWNLVLSCRRCSHVTEGKSDRVPGATLLHRLSARNEFLIGSHHPLRDTLVAQTGATAEERRAFLDAFHREAREALIHDWDPAPVREPLF